MKRVTGMLMAGVAFGGAVTVFGVALVDAMRVDTAPQVAATTQMPMDVASPSAAPAVAPSGSPASEARGPESAAPGQAARGLEAWVAQTTSPRLGRIELDRAVSQDPFQPDRRAPAQRYVLPGQRRVFTRVEREPTPAPEFRVVGAARIGGGGLALVQVDDGDLPVAINVGESIEGYRLVSVTDEGATFEGATLTADGESWALSVVEPREERRRGNNNRGNNNRGRNTREQAAQQDVAAQLQQLIQGGVQGLLFQGGLPQGGRAGFRGRGGAGGNFDFVGRIGRGGGGGGGQ